MQKKKRIYEANRNTETKKRVNCKEQEEVDVILFYSTLDNYPCHVLIAHKAVCAVAVVVVAACFLFLFCLSFFFVLLELCKLGLVA